MIGYAPSWLFGVLAVAALGGTATGSRSVLPRPVLTGEACRSGGGQPEVHPLLVFLAVAVVAATLRVLGA